jgi:Rieske Fe-S protein
VPREAFWLAPQDRIKVLASLAALAGAVTLIIAFLAVLAAFAWPQQEIGNPLRRLYVGTVDQFQVGQPVTFPEGKFHLVKQPDGSFVALFWKSTGLGCSVPWRESFLFIDPRDGVSKAGWFRDPCHGSTWDVNGVRVFGPAPRDLDRFPVEVKGGRVYVHAVERLLIRGATAR